MSTTIDNLKEQITSGNWALAAGSLLQVAVEAARESQPDPEWERFDLGTEAMKKVSIEVLRETYRMISRDPNNASSIIGTTLEALKRYDTTELRRAIDEQAGTTTEQSDNAQ